MGIRLSYNYVKSDQNSSSTFISSLTSVTTLQTSSISTTHEISSNQLAAFVISAVILSFLITVSIIIFIIYKCRKPVRTVQQIQQNQTASGQTSSESDVVVNMHAMPPLALNVSRATGSLDLPAPPAPVAAYVRKQKFVLR